MNMPAMLPTSLPYPPTNEMLDAGYEKLCEIINARRGFAGDLYHVMAMAAPAPAPGDDLRAAQAPQAAEPHPAWIDQKALEVARRFTLDTEPQRRASLQCAVIEAMLFARPDIAQASQAAEPAWLLIDPDGKVTARETTCIKAWARINGYKPTVEGLLGYEEKGWRVVAPQARAAQPLTAANTTTSMDHPPISIAEQVLGISPPAQGEQP